MLVAVIIGRLRGSPGRGWSRRWMERLRLRSARAKLGFTRRPLGSEGWSQETISIVRRNQGVFELISPSSAQKARHYAWSGSSQRCELCGATDGIEVHHIRKLA